jgi:hypothetical protein
LLFALLYVWHQKLALFGSIQVDGCRGAFSQVGGRCMAGAIDELCLHCIDLVVADGRLVVMAVAVCIKLSCWSLTEA